MMVFVADLSGDSDPAKFASPPRKPVNQIAPADEYRPGPFRAIFGRSEPDRST
jgi:hypothetical protein